jgi:hypothetical protein
MVDTSLDNSDKHFKKAMDVLVVMSVVLPFVQIFFGEFRWSSFFSSLSIATSMAVATMFFKKTMIEQGYKVKMTSFVILVWSTPAVVIGSIVASHYFEYAKALLDVFPVYMMMPLLTYMFCIFRCIYKSIETDCHKSSILSAMQLDKKDYQIVMDFNNNIFYESFGNWKVFIGENVIAGSSLSVSKISNEYHVIAVSEMNETPRNKLTLEHFMVAEMVEI